MANYHKIKRGNVVEGILFRLITVILDNFQIIHLKSQTMKVISTNLGPKIKVAWKGKEIETGIFKSPVGTPIYLGKEDVQGDHVIDRRYHGGISKACYCYSADHYDFWKAKYPELNWDWGMFGENLTIEGLDESSIWIGDIYQVGQAKVCISKPRQPCFKLGIRFGTQQALKDFMEAPYPGTYLSILEEGAVQVGDTFQLLERNEQSVSVLAIYELLFRKEADQSIVNRALQLDSLGEGQLGTIRKKWLKKTT